MALANYTVLEGRGILAVAGPDRRDFLQGLVSNDVARVTGDRAVHAALLTAQGRYLHDFIMVERGDEIWLDSEAARLADLQRRLSVYRLRARVDIAARPHLAVAAAFGEGAPAALDLPIEEGAARIWASGIALVDPRLAALGIRIIAEREALARLDATFAASDVAAFDRHRLRLGIPDGSRDLVPDKSLLLEAGFDELNGVDWQKGCYVGQELTARTKYRGLVKRRLFPVEIAGAPPPPGSIVTAEGREDAGEMRSSQGGIGLALLRRNAIVDCRRLTVGDAVLTPFLPPWMRRAEA
jgi:folate-binding protein YgfZ